MRKAHLVCVTSANNNKFYDMVEKPDGTFEATYGRIGVTATKITYPIGKWESIMRQKLAKGYQDMTDLATVTQVHVQEESGYKPIEDRDIAGVIDYLCQKARATIRKHYTVAANEVSPAMVASAQQILDDLVAAGNISTRSFNNQLLELFTVIPRQMGKVSSYLAESESDYEKIIQREQRLLDVMSSQVAGGVVKTVQTGEKDKTILEAYGLEFSPVTDKDIAVIKKELGKECERLFYKAWRVENLATRDKFQAFTKGKGRITKKLFWHGSRTENWLSILRTGLVLRPTNVITNGHMFGYGLYFAPLARKSVGYTSLRGSYWAHGSSEFGFMGLYEVVYGKPYHVDTAGFSDMTYERLQRVAPGCSCMHVHAGPVLRNDEVIVYREDQTTIKYLVELRAS